MVFGREWPLLAGGGFSRTAAPRDASGLPSRRRQNGRGADETQRLPKRRRIRKRSEFVRIQQNYRGRRTPHFVVIVAPGPEPLGRLGITVSKKIGNAVQRNRIKRRIREFFRLHGNKLQPAHDLLIIARAGADRLSFRDVESELARALAIELD